MNPMDQITPATSRCGHNFAIPKCPYKHCGARELYEALKQAEETIHVWHDLHFVQTSRELSRDIQKTAAWNAYQKSPEITQIRAALTVAAPPLSEQMQNREVAALGEVDPDRPPAEWPAQVVPDDPIERYLSILTPEQEGAIEPTSPVMMAIAVGVLNAAKELKRIATAIERGADELHG